MQASTSTSPDGRTVVHLQDNGGEPSKFISDAISVLGISEFNEIISIPLAADAKAAPPRPAFVRGQILITAQDAPFTNPVGIEYVLAEIVVIGYVGSSSTVIKRGMLGGMQQSMRVAFQEDDTFDRIAILARQIVDGQPSSVSTSLVDVLQVSAVAIMWS